MCPKLENKDGVKNGKGKPKENKFFPQVKPHSA